MDVDIHYCYIVIWATTTENSHIILKPFKKKILYIYHYNLTEKKIVILLINIIIIIIIITFVQYPSNGEQQSLHIYKYSSIPNSKIINS